MKAYETLQAFWATNDPPYIRRPNHGEAEVAALEERFGVRLPEDFRDYLLYAAMTTDNAWDMDDNGLCWWDLGRIRTAAEEFDQDGLPPDVICEARQALVFVDHAIDCYHWAICCRKGQNVGRIFSEQGDFVANSLADFVSKAVTGVWGLFVPS